MVESGTNIDDTTNAHVSHEVVITTIAAEEKVSKVEDGLGHSSSNQNPKMTEEAIQESEKLHSSSLVSGLPPEPTIQDQVDQKTRLNDVQDPSSTTLSSDNENLSNSNSTGLENKDNSQETLDRSDNDVQDKMKPLDLSPEIPITSIDLALSEESLDLINELGSVLPDICFGETLKLFDENDDGIGETVVKIEEGSIPDMHGYIVSVDSTLESKGVRIETHLNASISPNLMTRSQKQYKKIMSGDKKEQSIDRTITSDKTSIFVTEKVNNDPPIQLRFEKANCKGLLFDGSDKVLQRILLQNGKLVNTSEKFTFLTCHNGKIRHLIYETFPLSNHPIAGENKTLFTIKKSVVLEPSEQQNEAKSNEGQSMYTNYSYFDQLGKCILMKGNDNLVAIGNKILSDNLDDFSGDIELLSKFKEEKESLATAYQKYVNEHPELKDILTDFLRLVLHRKPDDVYAFSKSYFSHV